MLIEVKVPALSESVAEATLLAWNKKVGEKVNRDDNLIDVETDKVVLELPAPGNGVLKEILKGEGDTVVADEVIARIDTEGVAIVPTDSIKDEKYELVNPPVDSDERKDVAATEKVMPAAKKLATDKNVDLSKVTGTGRDGRITKGDVIGFLATNGETAFSAENRVNTESKNEITTREIQRVPMSRLRKRVAERLVQSQSTAAILSTFNEVNMQPVISLRNKYKEKFEKEHGVKLGFMSFFVKAVVSGLIKYPIVNASVDAEDILYHNYFDVGIAVGSPRGLVVPILKNADNLSFSDIEKSIADFGKRAQEGKLTIEELTGGTFSISNGGVFGSMLSTPIINPPQSAILGVHATKERAVVEDGEVVIRPMNYLALSYDHRIIDGREAVLFLVSVKEALEDPARLLLDV